MATTEREIKLSTLMRIGAKVTPQIKGNLKTPEGTCAVGAIKQGVAEITGRCFEETVSLGSLRSVKIRKEGSPTNQDLDLLNTIFRLNDQMGWTREEIAQWLDEIHEKYDLTVTLEVELQSKDLERVEYSSPPHLEPTALHREESWDSVPEEVKAVA